jgi:DNA-binding transcriptional LysR family regulator
VLGEIDYAAQSLRRRATPEVVVGVSTYFGSRWLSRRLGRFLTKHPDVVLRLQPTIGDSALTSADVDVAVVWGSHDRFRPLYQLLLESKVTPMTGSKLAKTIAASGMQGGLKGISLIHDDETREAWRRWLSAAGLNDRGVRRGPIIPDANMRVQAIIDGQGIALFDELVSNELDRGLLVAPSDVFLGGFGYYLAVADLRTGRREVEALLQWLNEEASSTAVL